MNAVDVRAELVRALRLDAIGPDPGEPEENEALPQSPLEWYLTGFLVPYQAKAEDRQDPTSREDVDEGGTPGGGDDSPDQDKPSARRAFLLSSLGLSVLVPGKARSVKAHVTWGDYRLVKPAEELDRQGEGEPNAAGTEGTGESVAPDGSERVRPGGGQPGAPLGGQSDVERGGQPSGPGAGQPRRRTCWQRTPRSVEAVVSVAEGTGKPVSLDLPGTDGLRLVASVRKVPDVDVTAGGANRLVPRGTRALAVFLVNHREPGEDERKAEALVYQAALSLRCDEGFVARPNLSGLASEEWDEKVADLQYRDCFEWAVGHGVATCAVPGAGGTCHEVTTTWVPTAEVEKVEPRVLQGIELSMEALAEMASADEVRRGVGDLVAQYRSWIEDQRSKAPGSGQRGEVAGLLLDDAAAMADRIGAGIAALGDPEVLEAFRLTNKVMALSARQREAQIRGRAPSEVPAPTWRPFQLAFLLMNLKGIADPEHAEREIVDLLFFPTGGGKTEAYLGLAAFTLILRRLRNPGLASAGVSVLMRYTLRLLTLDQLSRAATLICALERERQRDVTKLGTWPFEIGLWVGQAATPNRMGEKGDQSPDSARKRTIAFRNNDKKPCPIPIENCPWCGTRFKAVSFRLEPNPDRPKNLVIRCADPACAFTGDNPLPIVAVDEPLYRRLPCFVIATVDKFASLPWVGEVGALFGKVQRHDRDGFYGPCDPGVGQPLNKTLLPPELIIQDELHLISGPLGTVAGLYEAAIETLCLREVGGHRIRPKIVASTATVRRAERQIQALFGRHQTRIFPPPGPDRRDSFFALTVPRDRKAARLYLGLAAQGRSPKVLLLRSYLPLLGAGQRLWVAEGGRRNKDNPADPYMTLVGYFNALRELGGSRRIVEDEVGVRLSAYGARKRVGEATGPFADRGINPEPVELTSRESTSAVAGAKRRLGLGFSQKEAVDVALATNMISVGLDISRLGLMVVLGQPKTTAEYIQATSRVGRDDARPGLVVTLLNVHRPRDRSHFERFEAYHASFYRAVEVTSVTPFAPRAVDRALAAVTVGLARHGHGPLTPARAALDVEAERTKLDFVADAIVRRAQAHAPLSKEEEDALSARLRQRVADLLDEWSRLAAQRRDKGATLQYQEHEATGPFLLRDPLDPTLDEATAGERKFRAHRSMRDVEPSAPLWVKRFDGVPLPPEAE